MKKVTIYAAVIEFWDEGTRQYLDEFLPAEKSGITQVALKPNTNSGFFGGVLLSEEEFNDKWIIIDSITVPDNKLGRWFGIQMMQEAYRRFRNYAEKYAVEWTIYHNAQENSYHLTETKNTSGVTKNDVVIFKFIHFDYERAKMIYDKITQEHWERTYGPFKEEGDVG